MKLSHNWCLCYVMINNKCYTGSSKKVEMNISGPLTLFLCHSPKLSFYLFIFILLYFIIFHHNLSPFYPPPPPPTSPTPHNHRIVVHVHEFFLFFPFFAQSLYPSKPSAFTPLPLCMYVHTRVCTTLFSFQITEKPLHF